MKPVFINYTKENYPTEETERMGKEHFTYMNKRRTVRDFSSREVSAELLENIIMTASTAPSGAHKQPWTFCVVRDKDLKKQIRIAAEKEEYKNYHGRMSEEWLNDLAYLGTDWHKPFLEEAPALIVVFKHSYELLNTTKKTNYYVSESVGIACGFLLEAIHYCGLAALTHTPSPMNFLIKLLKRPPNEKPYLLIPVGYPAENAKVPDLKRKGSKQVICWY